MTKRALITGAAGQDGRYLTDLLLARGYQVFGAVGPNPGDYAQWATERDELSMVNCDLADQSSLDDVIAATTPDEVYNFAGLSSVGASWEQHELFLDINGRGVGRLLSAVAQFAPRARFVQASSAEIFGDPDSSVQSEGTPIAPTNPYGESKAYGHRSVVAARERGVHASNAILYNHESPMRPTTFVTAKIADAAARIKLGLAEELVLGNIDVVRDWGYAGDYVEAMTLIAAADSPDDYIVATGEGHTVRDFAQKAFGYLGLDYARYVRVDQALYRTADAHALVGDATRIRQAVGWSPSVDFDHLVGMMVNAALSRHRGAAPEDGESR